MAHNELRANFSRIQINPCDAKCHVYMKLDNIGKMLCKQHQAITWTKLVQVMAWCCKLFCFKFPPRFVPEGLTVNPHWFHWFRYWLGTEHPPSHYPNQWCLNYMEQQGNNESTTEQNIFLTLYMLNFSEGTQTYIHFVSLLHIDMTQVLKILQVREGPTYPI